MGWIKRNLIWIVGLLVFALAVLGSLLFLKGQVVERDKVASELDQQRNELNRLVTRPIFPAPQNVTQLKDDNQRLEKWIFELQTKFAKQEAPSEALTGIKFREVMNKRLQDLTRLARQKSVTTPGQDYLFSFDMYEKTIPENTHVPLLMKQLAVIEEICATLFNSPRIHQLLTLERIDFEDADEGGGRGQGAQAFDLPNGFKGIQNDPSKIYTVMPFELTLVCDPEGIRTFINNLAQSKYILIPAYVRIKCDESEVSGKVKKPEVTPEGEVFTPVSPEVRIAEETTKYVLGEQNITVSVRIDWVEFRPIEKPEEQKERKSRKGKSGESGEEGAEEEAPAKEGAAS